jgi:hypothetical protein
MTLIVLVKQGGKDTDCQLSGCFLVVKSGKERVRISSFFLIDYQRIYCCKIFVDEV